MMPFKANLKKETNIEAKKVRKLKEESLSLSQRGHLKVIYTVSRAFKTSLGKPQIKMIKRITSKMSKQQMIETQFLRLRDPGVFT